jgi:eukaryotic-like serine/threonine-protein kinase
LDVRAIDDFASRPLAGTENGRHPFFSPDGKWIAFFADGKLQKIPTEGGPATLIAEMPTANGGAWASNGDIIVGGAMGARGVGLLKVPAGGGALKRLTHPDSASGESHVGPVVLADGRTILFSSESGTGVLAANVVAVGSLDDTAFTRLRVPAVRPLGVARGHLVFTRSDGALMGVPFDVARRRATGDARVLGPQVADLAMTAALSSRGQTLMYLEGNTLSRVGWIDGGGNV